MLSRSQVAFAAAGVVVASVAASLGAGAMASACSTTFGEPDSDSGPYPSEDGGHPPPSMYGSPCQMAAGGPEPCCGDVAKRGLGKDCYGCTTHYSYSMCVNGEFTCACTCEVPEGFMVIIRGDDAGCADGGQEGGGLEDVRAPLDAGDEGAADAREDGPSDAAGPTEDAGDAD